MREELFFFCLVPDEKTNETPEHGGQAYTHACMHACIRVTFSTDEHDECMLSGGLELAGSKQRRVGGYPRPSLGGDGVLKSGRGQSTDGRTRLHLLDAHLRRTMLPAFLLSFPYPNDLFFFSSVSLTASGFLLWTKPRCESSPTSSGRLFTCSSSPSRWPCASTAGPCGPLAPSCWCGTCWIACTSPPECEEVCLIERVPERKGTRWPHLSVLFSSPAWGPRIAILHGCQSTSMFVLCVVYVFRLSSVCLLRSYSMCLSLSSQSERLRCSACRRECPPTRRHDRGVAVHVLALLGPGVGTRGKLSVASATMCTHLSRVPAPSTILARILV